MAAEANDSSCLDRGFRVCSKLLDGSKTEDDFLSTCIKCGLCVEACPFDTLKLAKPGDNLPLGTPYFVPRNIPCYMCVDIPCVPICPTDALDEKKVKNKDKIFFLFMISKIFK